MKKNETKNEESIEKISFEDVEVINTQEDKEPKVQKIGANESVADFMKKINGATQGADKLFENPIVKLMSDPIEMAKAKVGAVLIILSYFCGIIGLFGFREYMATSAFVFGISAYLFGAQILKKGALFGVFLGLLGLTFYAL